MEKGLFNSHNNNDTLNIFISEIIIQCISKTFIAPPAHVRRYAPFKAVHLLQLSSLNAVRIAKCEEKQ